MGNLQYKKQVRKELKTCPLQFDNFEMKKKETGRCLQLQGPGCVSRGHHSSQDGQDEGSIYETAAQDLCPRQRYQARLAHRIYVEKVCISTSVMFLMVEQSYAKEIFEEQLNMGSFGLNSEAKEIC